MGCGAVCGSQSTVAESSRQAQAQFMSLFKQITPNLFLYPVKAIAKFTKQMQLNPHRLQLVLTEKLQPKHMISMGVVEKWKIILFGLDCDRNAYVNCLGYPEGSLKAKSGLEKQQHDDPPNQKQAAGLQSSQKIELIQHKAFSQIEKDIERTFPGIEFQKKSFTTILKRITNHFPAMGYTQGINFIVGYLLIIGFSESDAFWFFIHFALNRRYMMLGLYQDGFPLINVYTSIFRNILKRIKPKLYTHLYEQVVMFQQSAWVFKWFMTCFLSSFPIEMCQYVWDLVICNGGISLVYFAMSLVLKLQKQLLEMDDACDISEFFNSLKNIQTFNRYLSIRDVVRQAYKIRYQSEDLSQLREVKTQRGGSNFYAQYFLFKYEEEISQKLKTPRLQKTQLARVSDQLHQSNPILFKKLSGSRSSQLLTEWYQKLTKQREQFHMKSLIKASPYSKSKTIIIGLQNSQQLSGEPGLPSDIELPKNSRISIQQFGSLINFDVEEEIHKDSHELKNNSVSRFQNPAGRDENGFGGKEDSKGESLQISPTNNRQKNIMSRYTNKKIRNQQHLWKDDDEQQQRQQNKDKINHLQQQFFYISRDIRFKRKNTTYQSEDALTDLLKKTKPKQNNNYIPKQLQSKQQIQSSNTITHLTVNSHTNTNMNHSRLARVGNAVLSNMSASNASNKSSASSYRTNNHKENPHSNNNNNANTVVRFCKCMKNKTEENQVQTISKPASRKNIEKVSQHQPEEIIQYEQSADFTNARKRMNTYHDWMVNSQGPREVRNLASSNVKQTSEIGSEVEIIHGREMFKKKNRISGRIGGGVGVVHECTHVVENQISECQSRIDPTPALADQESVQSFIIANVSSRRSDLAEIESVK